MINEPTEKNTKIKCQAALANPATAIKSNYRPLSNYFGIFQTN